MLGLLGEVSLTFDISIKVTVRGAMGSIGDLEEELAEENYINEGILSSISI